MPKLLHARSPDWPAVLQGPHIFAMPTTLVISFAGLQNGQPMMERAPSTHLAHWYVEAIKLYS
jgi:hypothetical protein